MSDIERTEKDKKFLQKTEKTASDIDIYNNNVLLIYINKKTERLTAAVFMLTDTLPEVEPLRTHLRAVCLRLLGQCAEIGASAERRLLLGRCTSSVGEILSLLSVAASVRSISPDNIDILEEEYRKLAALFFEKSLLQSAEGFFTSSFFEVKSSGSEAYEQPSVQPYRSRFADIATPLTPRFKPAEPAGGRGGRMASAATSTASARQSQVLSVIEKKGKVTIRDVVEAIKDCSEKTIQRELAALVAGGVLKREGERRWSTYRKA